MKTKPKPKVVHHSALVVVGVEGACLYIDGYRVAGPKPWGGGKPMYEFKFTDADLKEAERSRRAHARSTDPSATGDV